MNIVCLSKKEKKYLYIRKSKEILITPYFLQWICDSQKSSMFLYREFSESHFSSHEYLSDYLKA